MTHYSRHFECWNFFLQQHAICCKTGIRNDDSAQLSNVPYTQYSSDNRSALNPSKYSKNINFYGRLNLCLHPNVSVTTNHSRQFKCHDVTVMANHAEGLISIHSLTLPLWRLGTTDLGTATRTHKDKHDLHIRHLFLLCEVWLISTDCPEIVNLHLYCMWETQHR
jgi:hypothetical protein